MCIYLDREGISDYDMLFEKSAKYNVIPYDMAFRRIRENRILLSDRFDAVKKERNNDYAKKGLETAFQNNNIHNYELINSELFWDC